VADQMLGRIRGARDHFGWKVRRPLVAAVTGMRLRQAKPTLPFLVARQDEMYDGYFAKEYFRVGSDALHLVRQALLVTGRPPPRRILDLPCGHGRVLRWLRAEWPTAEIVACDLNRAGVDFCVATMGARALYSSTKLEDVDLGEPFDVVWVGSLLTHLDQPRWRPTLRALAGALAPGGVMMFTTHGQQAREFARQVSYGLRPADLEAVIEGWATTGFGYRDYPAGGDYGIAFSTPAWVRSVMADIPGLEERAFWLAGWGHHHDVFAYQRIADRPPTL
jgi:SAM-dependent methyltransferase